MPLAPAIFTFYSYKGGVGRSMSALNVAYCLAARGRHVLLVDMDLEAAGLSGLLVKQGELPDPAPRDVVDLLQWARDVSVLDAVHAEDPAWVKQHAPNLLPFLSRISDEKIATLVPQGGQIGSLYVLGADQDRNYAQRLTSLGLTSLDADQLMRVSRLVRQVFHQFRLGLPVQRYIDLSERDDVPFDYVLVDSRTGLTEVGGLCVGPLADRIVVLCGLNGQNIDGTRRALEILGITGEAGIDGPWDAFLPPPSERVPLMGIKPTLLVASPVPSGEITLRKQRIAEMERSLSGQVAVQLPYEPQLALYETIFVRESPIEPLARRYLDLAVLLERAVSDHASQLFRPSMEIKDPTQRLTELHRLLRLAKDEPKIGIPVLRALLDQLPELDWSEGDYKVFDQILALMTQDGMPDIWVGLFKRAVVLASWAEHTELPLLAIERRRAALRYVDLAIGSRAVPPDKLGVMHGVRGRILLDHAEWAEALQSITIALQTEQRDHERAALLARRGFAHRELRQSEAAIQDFTEALGTNALKPKELAKTYLGRGLSYGELQRVQEALSDLAEVLKIREVDPSDEMAAHFGLAIASNQAKDFDRALSEYGLIISAPQTMPVLRIRALINRGELYIRQEKYPQAVEDLNAAYSQSGMERELAWAALTNRALAYSRIEQWQSAESDALTVLKEPGVSADLRAHALFAAVVANVGLGELETARHFYAKLDSLNDSPQNLRPSALVSLGWGAYLQKDYHLSVSLSQQAVDQANDDSTRYIARANLGLALLHLGDVTAAHAAYAALLSGGGGRQVIEAARKDLRDALVVQPLLPGAQQVYEALGTCLPMPETE